MKEGCIPEKSKYSRLIPVYKGKGEPLDCSSYRGIKLLEQEMKVAEEFLITEFGNR